MDITEQLWLLKQIYSSNNTYYDDNGMYLHHISPKFPAEDLERLSQWHRLPNQMAVTDHEEVLNELYRLTEKWTLTEAADAFIAGLWSAPFLWKSVLPAKLMALSMPVHEHVPYSDSSTVCKICGYRDKAVDTTLLWYSRMTQGAPLDGEPVGHVWALREMEQMEERPVPTGYDIWTFRAILTVIRSLPPKARYSKARDELCRERLLPSSSKWVYGSLLETLALIGVLDTEDYPGMATQFTTYHRRDDRPSPRVEPQAPLAWWNSSIGVNEAVLKGIFPTLDCSSVSLENRPPAIPPLTQTVTGGLEKRKLPRRTFPKSPDAGKGPVQAGDVYAVWIQDGIWITVYCHRFVENRVVVEYLDGIFSEMPTKAQLKNTIRPRRDGRWQMKAISIDKTTGVKRVARNIAVPLTELPEPDRIPYGGARELKYLAHWCFSEIDP